MFGLSRLAVLGKLGLQAIYGIFGQFGPGTGAGFAMPTLFYTIFKSAGHPGPDCGMQYRRFSTCRSISCLLSGEFSLSTRVNGPAGCPKGGKLTWELRFAAGKQQLYRSRAFSQLLWGRLVNLRPIGNRPARFRSAGQADCQSAAGYHPAPQYL